MIRDLVLNFFLFNLFCFNFFRSFLVLVISIHTCIVWLKSIIKLIPLIFNNIYVKKKKETWYMIFSLQWLIISFYLEKLNSHLIYLPIFRQGLNKTKNIIGSKCVFKTTHNLALYCDLFLVMFIHHIMHTLHLLLISHYYRLLTPS